jgi:hypothetical protein
MFSCVGDTLRWQAGAIEVVATIEYDDNADTSYLDYEWNAERKAAYMRHEYDYCGIVARVLLDVDGRDVEIGGASLWGIESDSGEEYLEEQARELATEAINDAGQYMPALAQLLAEHEGELATLSSLVAVD